MPKKPWRPPDLIRPPVVGERYKAYVEVAGEMHRQLRAVQVEMQKLVGPWRLVKFTHVIRHLLQLGIEEHNKLYSSNKPKRPRGSSSGTNWRGVYQTPPTTDRSEIRSAS